MSIKENLRAFQDDLDAAAAHYGRDAAAIKVMAVSKTRSVEEIVEARAAGLDLFGENRVEEAAGKFAALDAKDYPLVLIGHLQGNKAAKIDRRFSGVHSVDSEKIAERLSRRRDAEGAPLEILLQVNTSGEEAKSGFRDRVAFAEAAERISRLPMITLRGVMTMAPFVDDEAVVRACFAACREWSEDIRGLVDGDPVLSMGMSTDYAWAVAEGSTMLRIGTTLFGRRA